MVIAYLALFVALGGTSYAALTITGKQVRDSSRTGRDIRNSSLTTADVRRSGADCWGWLLAGRSRTLRIVATTATGYDEHGDCRRS